VPRPLNALCREFLLGGLPANAPVLDVGCGTGELMGALSGNGHPVLGVEIDPALVAHCRNAGLEVIEGQAEHLPFPDASVDAIVCSVVLPYTDERLAVAEWARVLKPGGVVNVTCHGIGYGLNYLIRGHGLRKRIYGLRMLVNSAAYASLQRRLPGFMGDTLCQTSRRLRRYYSAHGLELLQEEVFGKTLGMPQFLCHRLRRPRISA
jgi:SAM-dependent methyltransferase